MRPRRSPLCLWRETAAASPDGALPKRVAVKQVCTEFQPHAHLLPFVRWSRPLLDMAHR